MLNLSKVNSRHINRYDNKETHRRVFSEFALIKFVIVKIIIVVTIISTVTVTATTTITQIIKRLMITR